MVVVDVVGCAVYGRRRGGLWVIWGGYDFDQEEKGDGCADETVDGLVWLLIKEKLSDMLRGFMFWLYFPRTFRVVEVIISAESRSIVEF